MEVATCASISALTLGLPAQTAMASGKGVLPNQMFYAKAHVSLGLKQRFTHDIAQIVVLAVLNAANTHISAEGKLHEILVIGVQLNTLAVPTDALEHIATLRPSGVLFVCVRQKDGIEECALALRRALPGRAGHEQHSTVFVSQWRLARDTVLSVQGLTIDEIWESLNAQTILDSADPANLETRIAAHRTIRELTALEAKLTKDHARAKDATQRNRIYAALHKTRTQLAQLRHDMQ